MKITYKEQKIGGMVLNWATIFIQIIVSLFFVPFFLHIVGDKQYGLYSFSTSIIAWIDTLVVAIASAYFRFLTREKKECGEYGEARACGVFWVIFVFISLLVLVIGISFDALLFFRVIPFRDYNLLEKNQICLIILMSVCSTVISSLLTVRKSYHFYKQKFILVYASSFSQVVLQSLVSYFLLKRGYGVIGVALVHFGVALIFTVALSIISRQFLKQKISIKPQSSDDKQYRKKLLLEILVFSGFIIINTIVETMNRSLDKTILGFYNAYSVSTYQLAYTFPSYLISFTSIISIVFDQQVNEAFFNGKGLEEVNAIYLKVSKLQTIISFLIIGGFIACGKEFVTMWLHESRNEVYYIASILMLIYSITCCNRLGIIARRVQSKHKKASLIYLGIAISNVLFSIFFVNIFSKQSAIWACVLGTGITFIIGHWIIMQIYDKRITGIDVTSFFFTFIKFLFLSLTIDLLSIRTCEVFGISNNLVSFFTKGIVFVVCYIIGVLVLEKPLVNEVLSNIKKKIHKTKQKTL